MSSQAKISVLAPFSVRSFRFQWPADLLTSWAFEMETLILAWYVLVESRSVLLLTVFASLQYIGTLFSPMMGVMGDRLGHRNLLCAMRAFYAFLALALMSLAFAGLLTAHIVLVIAALMGLVKPSDIGERLALVGETMPGAQLIGAMSIQRTTLDSARIAGALSGAGLVATFGMGTAYVVVTSLYAASVFLTFRSGGAATATGRSAREPGATPRASPWRELKAGLHYVRTTPHLLGVMCLASLLNLTAFPLFFGLMPVVVKEVYHADQTVLGYMAASGAFGALMGSIALSRFGRAIRAARMMLIFSAGWYAMLLVFAHTGSPATGIPILMLAGCAQSLSQIPMATLLLRHSDEQFRGRLMGIRMLAIYSNLPGLLIAGPLIARYGYPALATLYCVSGFAFTLFVAIRWRAHFWRLDARANTR